jgi:hypothetical protein
MSRRGYRNEYMAHFLREKNDFPLSVYDSGRVYRNEYMQWLQQDRAAMQALLCARQPVKVRIQAEKEI